MGIAFSRRAVVAAALAGALATHASAQPAQLLDALTQGDASAGLKEALSLASGRATNRLGSGGFLNDLRVHIPLPGVLGQTQRSLKRMGLAAPLDDLETRMNTAAQQAMPEAGRIFMTVVRSLTIADAVRIVRGGDTAATTFLRERSETRLTTLITPPMTRTLRDAGAFTALDYAARQVGVGSMSTRLRQDVTTFAVQKSLDGAFLYIGEEERAIRRDPVRRTSDILRRVFG
jgi:hypothetical protein